MKSSLRATHPILIGAIFSLIIPSSMLAKDDPLAWPAITTQAKPHAYWWWMGSAVDTNNIAKELARYQAAGMGGVHIIPIYGAKGWESNYIPYLSPKWMEMLDFTVKEAKRRGMEVDMTTGSGWCFGGPKVTDDEANAVLVSSEWQVAGGQRLTAKVNRSKTQALMAFGPDGKKVDLLNKISADSSVDWTAPEGKWTVYAVSQKPSGQKVKRAAPGGEGWMLNLASPKAMEDYLGWMDSAFANYKGAKPRAQYHDSYEYKMDWSPELLAEFEKRRGYRLQDHLDAFITGKPADRAARVKCDYRETISDLLVENTARWNQWAHDRGFITRNEAHGAPGNWLDLYAAADIPETEMFHLDRNILISKFASSAAHVSGKPLVGAETGTWLTEHFTETLADMKFLLDDLFLSGVNHVFYHGTCYSPDEAPWPGWVFYASYEMNPRNAVWHDVAALNAYAARCQSVLQAGQPDNDILLYWPIHDFWSNAEGTTRNLTVHARDWFEDQPIGKTAKELWDNGYTFDYVSDAQLKAAKVADGKIRMPGGKYQLIVVPESKCIPLATFKQLLALAEAGATVVFENRLPADVAGLGDLGRQRAEFKDLSSKIELWRSHQNVSVANVGKGLVMTHESSSLKWYAQARITGEQLGGHGLSFIRRAMSDGRYYFIANRGDKVVDGWVPLATQAKSVTIMDPMTGKTSVAASRQSAANQTEVKLNLSAGASVILRTFDSQEVKESASSPRRLQDWQAAGDSVVLGGQWQVKFLSGGPELPASFDTERLASWTELGDTNAASFAGTAVYALKFDANGDRLKAGLQTQLDLGKVCQSARVRLNGKDYGTLFTPPFRVVVDNLKAKDNLLKVEVTSTSANRIRDLDRRGVKWQNFHDINFVNLNYKKFDASNWPLADAGLLGPVTLTPVSEVKP
ncbi:MAG: hypothetical protein RLY20_3218 [Verrucomicrobiota bacterium]|jgi:hypothetical protein